RGGLPFLAAQTLGLFVAKVDVPILGRLSGEAAVGWYAASSRLMEASNFVPVVLLIAMFPVLSRLWVQSPSEFQITVRKTLHFLLIPAFDLSSANGAIGAAIATLITEVFILVCALRAMPSGILGLESARVALRAAALGIGFAAVLFAGRTVGIPWVVALAVGGAMYLAAAQGFGLLPAELTAWVHGVV